MVAMVVEAEERRMGVRQKGQGKGAAWEAAARGGPVSMPHMPMIGPAGEAGAGGVAAVSQGTHGSPLPCWCLP